MGTYVVKDNKFRLKYADALEIAGVVVQPYVYASTTIPAGAVAGDFDGAFFIADRAYEVYQVRENHITAGSSTTASVDVLKVTNGQAKASGTSVLAAVIDCSTAAHTNQTPTLAALATRSLAAGDRLVANPAGTLTALDGVTVQVILKAI